MTEPFLLSVPINRPDVVEWLQTVPPDKLPPTVENTLAAGNLSLSMLQASTGEESMQRFFRPVLGPMQNLQGTLEGIMRATQKSQRLGELGEEIVAEQLKGSFPSDDFQVVSTLDHQADIHAGFVVNNEDVRKALFEVKLHSDDVPSQEVEKFRRDLRESGFRFGMMVSLTSRITGISGPFHLEETADFIAVYLPNAGIDGHRLLCATAMLKAIVLHQARTARLIPTGAIEQAWLRLNTEVQELKEVAAEVHDLRDSLQVAQQGVAGAFAKVTEKAMSAECRLRYALDRITNRLAEELGGLPHTAEPITLFAPTKPDEVLAFIADMRRAKDARVHAFEGMHELAQRSDLQIRLHEGHWQMLRAGMLVAWTNGTKTRLDVCVPVNLDSEPEISLDTRFEKLKTDHVVIAGTVPEKMLRRLETRLVDVTFKADLARLAAAGRDAG